MHGGSVAVVVDGVGGQSRASQENGTEERGRMPSRVGVG